ncbi:MAG: hypothetical protein PSX81_10405 [bacterium]|nr:hypothetical protein [bacterium]
MLRKNYPGIYKWAYATRREKELISIQEQNQIPKQTKSNWRKLSSAEIYLLEEDLQIRQQLEELYQKQDLSWYKKKRFFNKMARLNFLMIDLIGHDKYLKILGKTKKEFVSLIEEYSEFIPKKKLLICLNSVIIVI